MEAAEFRSWCSPNESDMHVHPLQYTEEQEVIHHLTIRQICLAYEQKRGDAWLRNLDLRQRTPNRPPAPQDEPWPDNLLPNSEFDVLEDNDLEGGVKAIAPGSLNAAPCSEHVRGKK